MTRSSRADPLSRDRLLVVAEDIEHFKTWWEHSENITNPLIRQGSAALRRLLVEDAVGTAWRQVGFSKAPTLQGPDLLASLKQRGIDVSLVASAVAAGIRFDGIDTAFLAAYRLENPTTGVPATADRGFAVAVDTAARKVSSGAAPSDLDALFDRTWRLPEYLDAPGLIRKGEKLSRRDVIKHMANEMGGVHLEKNRSNFRDLLVDAESKLFIESRKRESLRSFYIGVLAIGQSVGRARDFQNLAMTIRNHAI